MALVAAKIMFILQALCTPKKIKAIKEMKEENSNLNFAEKICQKPKFLVHF